MVTMQLASLLVFVLATPIQPLALSSGHKNVRLGCDELPDGYKASCSINEHISRTPISTSGDQQIKRSHQREVSVSPETLFQQPSSSNTNSTESQSSGFQAVSWWPPSTETILTAVFRAVMAIMSLLNMNVTWRIHGQSIASLSAKERPKCSCMI